MNKPLWRPSEEQQKSASDQDDTEIDHNLEDVRAQVSIQYIEQIDKFNLKIEDKKQRFIRNVEIRQRQVTELKEKQDLEIETLKYNLDKK